MEKEIVSATELKRNTAKIINSIIFGNKTVLIERYGNIVAELSPKNSSDSPIEKALLKYKGSFKSSGGDITKIRKELTEELNKMYAGSSPKLPDLKKYRSKNNLESVKKLYLKSE